MENITNITTNINRSVAQIDVNNVSSVVTACSGLGEKSEFYIERKMYSELAKDLVASTLNKLVCSGAQLAGFSEYILSGDKVVAEIIEREIAVELKKLNCPQMSVRTEYSDINNAFCATAVGINAPQKQEIVSGDIVVGFESSGLHVNGFSKIKELYRDGEIDNNDIMSYLKVSYNYYPEVIELYNKNKIKLGVNISKGGIYYCLNQVLPKGLSVDLNLKHIAPQPVFEKLKNLTGDDFFSTFNGGIGFCLIADRASDEIFFKESRKYNPIVLGVVV